MTNLRRRWRQSRAMTWADRALILEAWVTLVEARLRVALTSPGRSLAWAEDGARIGALQSNRLLRRAVRFTVFAAAWQPGNPACWPQSLCVARLLARRGVAAAVRIGVRLESGALRAHAWTEAASSGAGTRRALREPFVTLERVPAPARPGGPVGAAARADV